MAQQRALATTAAAHNNESLTTMDVERHIVEHGAITESPNEIIHLDDGFSVIFHAAKKNIPVRMAFITSMASKACTTEAVVA